MDEIFVPIFDKNINEKYSTLREEKLFLQVKFWWTSHLTKSQYQNYSQCQASMPVPGQETWVCACVHLVSQKTVINDSVSKLQTLKYQMQDISRCRHFNSFKNEDSLSLSLLLSFFVWDSIYIHTSSKSFKNVKFFNKWNLNAWHRLRMSKSIYFQALGICG